MVGNGFDKEFTLIRFFEKEDYVENFRNGNIRMMSAQHYKEMEFSLELYNTRYDSLENSNAIYNPNPDGTILWETPVQKGDPIQMGGEGCTGCWVNPEGELLSPIIISNDASDNMTKISCFYSLFKQNIVDDKLSSSISTMKGKFGDYYCLITNKNEFFRRITNGFLDYNSRKIAGNAKIGFPNYVDERKVNGRYGPFCKPAGLSWQREFRIILQTEKIDPFWFNIVSLKDITIWGKVSDLLNGKLDKDGNLIIDNYKTE